MPCPGPRPCSATGATTPTGPHCPGRPQDHRLHPLTQEPQGADPARRRPLPPTPQNRDHVRPPQGLASHPHPLRSMRTHFHVRHLHRRNRHLLDQSMSPEPRRRKLSAECLTRVDTGRTAQRRTQLFCCGLLDTVGLERKFGLSRHDLQMGHRFQDSRYGFRDRRAETASDSSSQKFLREHLVFLGASAAKF
jgi:hypothetical protein